MYKYKKAFRWQSACTVDQRVLVFSPCRLTLYTATSILERYLWVRRPGCGKWQAWKRHVLRTKLTQRSLCTHANSCVCECLQIRQCIPISVYCLFIHDDLYDLHAVCIICTSGIMSQNSMCGHSYISYTNLAFSVDRILSSLLIP